MHFPLPRFTPFLTSTSPSHFLGHDHAAHRDRTTPKSIDLRTPPQKPEWPRVTIGHGRASISGSGSRSREMGRIVGARPCQK